MLLQMNACEAAAAEPGLEFGIARLMELLFVDILRDQSRRAKSEHRPARRLGRPGDGESIARHARKHGTRLHGRGSCQKKRHFTLRVRLPLSQGFSRMPHPRHLQGEQVTSLHQNLRWFRAIWERRPLTTNAPSRRKPRAVAAPIPEPAPVTITTLSSNLFMISPR